MLMKILNRLDYWMFLLGWCLSTKSLIVVILTTKCSYGEKLSYIDTFVFRLDNSKMPLNLCKSSFYNLPHNWCLGWSFPIQQCQEWFRVGRSVSMNLQSLPLCFNSLQLNYQKLTNRCSSVSINFIAAPCDFSCWQLRISSNSWALFI